MVSQQYCLKWKHHNTNIQSTFSVLRDKACYCDVTIWCDGSAMRAHRAVLAACSDLFAELLAAHDISLGDPAIVLTDAVHAQNLRHLLSFMYTGEVRVHHGELAGLLKTAEELRIKGLADVSWSEPNISLETSCSVSAEPNSRPQSPIESRSFSITSKSEDESGKNTDDNLSTGSVVVTNTPVNGSIILPPLQSEPEKKRKSQPLETAIYDPPKRPKLSSMPNILRKSKTVEHRNDVILDVPTDWPSASRNVDPDNEDALSEYSEASLDGRDISQFLDTQMEEEPMDGSSKFPTKSLVPFSTDNSMTAEIDLSGNPKNNPMFADVVKLSDYLLSGRRTQFWTEDYVKRVMEAVFCRELEMKQAAEILGVSYGTLYGRYRDTFGCINRPYRAREFWAENSEILAKLIRKQITFVEASEMLNISPQMLFSYVSAFESAITQKELFEITQDKNNTLGFAKNKLTIKPRLSGELPSEDDSVIDLDKGFTESYNRLSEILRKHHDLQEAKANEAKIEVDPIVIDHLPEIKPIISEAILENKQEDFKTVKDDVSQKSFDEPSSSNSISIPKKLPMIRVANLKFLKGESPGPVNLYDIGEKINTNTPIVLKTVSSKKKVTFQEIESSLKLSNINIIKKSPTATTSATTSVKPPASVT